jgi:light-regulated signal transduction histidine kinase (bacteriophytochrome)
VCSPAEAPSTSLEQRLADAEAARDRALQELEKSKRAHAEFVTHITHELRTPLNAILGFAQILQGDSQLNERQQRGVSTILESGHNLLGLIDNLLEPKGTDTLTVSTRYVQHAGPNHEPDLELEAGAIPPQDEIAVLHGMALAGSMREILERAQWIEDLDARYRAFTQHVAALARAYQSQRVLSFIARHHRIG